ncbi:MAG: hypothetical protein PQJ50_03845, partial [Spirochaetales bacterium]|nr:hypothetical protein [Spirochaetales bacterium]
KGKRDLYLNDSATPKISYDFSAMIGEFGQVRESYRRTKLLHYFFSSFEDEFSRTATTLPENAGDMSPEDTEPLRYSCRSAGGRGFIFINNFQDHLQLPAREGLRMTVESSDGSVTIPEEGGFSIGEDSFCILPFRFKMGAAELRYATAQMVTRLSMGGKEYFFFLVPEGMEGEFCFEASGVKEITGAFTDSGSSLIVKAGSGKLFEMTDSEGQTFVICAMKDSESLDFWKTLSSDSSPADYTRALPDAPVERVYMTSGSLMDFGSSLKVESAGDEKISLKVFPDFEKPPVAGGRSLEGRRSEGPGMDSLFTEYSLSLPAKKVVPPVEYRSPDKAILSFTENMFEGVKELLLRISYSGDIGYAYIDGDLINDNFSNGTDWEIGLMQFKERLVRDGLYLYISPNMVGATVKSNTTMAGWSVDADEVIAQISSIEVVPVYEVEFKL